MHEHTLGREGCSSMPDETFHLEPSQQRSTTTASARSTTYPYSNALPWTWTQSYIQFCLVSVQTNHSHGLIYKQCHLSPAPWNPFGKHDNAYIFNKVGENSILGQSRGRKSKDSSARRQFQSRMDRLYTYIYTYIKSIYPCMFVYLCSAW